MLSDWQKKIYVDVVVELATGSCTIMQPMMLPFPATASSDRNSLITPARRWRTVAGPISTTEPGVKLVLVLRVLARRVHGHSTLRRLFDLAAQIE